MTPDDYVRHDATGLAALVAARQVSPSALLDLALAQTARLNPALNAVVLMQEAAARRLIEAAWPGPFAGVPFLLKDLGCEAVDFPSHNGSRLFADTVYSFDSAIYQRIRDAGLITFGRSTSPEEGIGPVTEAAVYGGPTRSPWDPARTSGGSSGGAGAAVAAGIVPMAHGSDGGGSVRIPASCCGLYGFKASRARFPDGPASGEGWGGMAIDGFLCRSVRDAAAIMDACAGPDLGAPYFAPPMQQSYSAALARPPRRLRVGLATTRFDGSAIDPEVVVAVEAAAALMESFGHTIIPMLPKADHGAMMQAWTRIVGCGTALSLRGALARGGPGLEAAQGISRSTIAYAEAISGADYLEAVGVIHAFGRQMAAAFEGIDVLLSPTLAEPPARVGRFSHERTDFENYRIGPGGVFEYSPFCAAFNASGQPAVSVPLGASADGLPIGIHLAAPMGEDAVLIAVSAELEAAAPWAGRLPALRGRG